MNNLFIGDPPPTRFYVSWMKPVKRARIHRGHCSHCNHGEGQVGQDKTGSDSTGWCGPYDLEGARAKAQAFVREGFTDVAFCGTCLRSRKL
jgi:hypothetical protein